MNGYTEISFIGNRNRSKSIDFSEFPAPKTFSPVNPKHLSDGIGFKSTQRDSMPEEGKERNGERFGPKLMRNSSVSSSSLQSAVKRAFSMKRSSSVSERYCRIHDQTVSLTCDEEGEGEGEGDTVARTRSVKKNHSRGRILKACKRLLGL
ncbi:hypothetical protein K2173_020962 [Erythroxylum novogranatense]|uniref:Uncharacterized protein n=1 Tax=Erythroxylum novogranatense TaxID=1862640 RepID=A0AAV8TM54_9ROSI|nr:hypothetical protein K2173_020962 [Erythroxylum novogranatense]